MKTVKVTEKQLKSLKTYLGEICYDEKISFKALGKIGLGDVYTADNDCGTLQNFFLVNDMYEDGNDIMQINIFDVEKFIHINGSNAYEANYWEDIDELRNQVRPDCNCGRCNYISESYLSA
tara:strand:+ start:421 stop:783 length:363 start_codon:yes stop_codon:yes gene_type:complete